MVKYEYETMEEYESRTKRIIRSWVFNMFMYGISAFIFGLIQVTEPLTILFKFLAIGLLVLLVLCCIGFLDIFQEELNHTKELNYLKNKITKK